MSQAMIISLGGTPEPLVRAMAEHRPQFVTFLASQDSVVLLGKVMELLDQEGLPRPAHRVVLVEDVNDLVHCYAKALEGARYLEEREIRAEEVVVDYTGGTKTMTAAVVLATVGRGYRFSYVGGARRTKGGLGIVESGYEEVYQGVSPWQIFAVAEWQHLILHVRQYQYEAALTLVRETRRRQPAAEQVLWNGLENALEGLLYWDRFHHREALPRFKEGLRALTQWLELRPRDQTAQALTGFVAQGERCLEFLVGLAADTRNFTREGPRLVQDLLANADRRASQGRYDDAMARLYRALEMLGQLAFREKLGASTSNVPEVKIPAGLREEYARRYRDPQDGKIKVPLEATFQVLKELDDPGARQFFERYEDFRRIMLARNQSILAHGIQPIDGPLYQTLRNLLIETFALQADLIFPQLRSPF